MILVSSMKPAQYAAQAPWPGLTWNWTVLGHEEHPHDFKSWQLVCKMPQRAADHMISMHANCAHSVAKVRRFL